jgi:opacity protein-like surface antigen
MKNFIIAAVAATALNSVYAENCASNFSGFYSGIQTGVTYTRSELKNADTGGKDENKRTLFTGGLFTGYGMGIGQCTYVGGEVYGNLARNNTLWVAPNVNIKTQNSGNIGAKIRFGYVLSPKAMIFLGLGIEYSRWKVELNHLGAVNRGVEKEYKKTISKVAFSPSIGSEIYVDKHIFVRGEYAYIAPVSGELEAKKANGERVAIKSTFNQHRFVLGLGYKF